jgi:hypothetical protein
MTFGRESSMRTLSFVRHALITSALERSPLPSASMRLKASAISSSSGSSGEIRRRKPPCRERSCGFGGSVGGADSITGAGKIGDEKASGAFGLRGVGIFEERG